MRIDVEMPQMGEGITEGTIVRWLKQPGEYVKKDEPLLEVSTDKVDTEVPSPYEGKLVEILAKENETVEVGRVIARLESEAGAGEAEAPTAPEAAPEPEPETAPQEPQPVASAPEPKPEAAAGGTAVVQDVTMPQLGESITEGTIVKWLKQPGDFVKRDEPLLEISTDKVDSEIPSPLEGVLTEILAQEGETVAVGAPIARIQVGEGAAAQPEAPPAAPVAEVEEKPAPQPSAAPAAETRPPKGRFYSPLVLRIAREEGISMEELQQIPGTGAGGRVTKNDILQYLQQRKVAAPAAPAAPAARPGPTPAPEITDQALKQKYQGQRVEIFPMDAIRKKIAQRMVESKATSPHVYGVAECDFSRVFNIVQEKRPDFERNEGFKLTFNPFILYATVKALLDFPRINASVEGDYIVEKKFINLGIAVATERGLIVPVLKNADEKNFRGIARTAYDLAMRAREGKLTLDDVQGSTFTVTNYGVFGNIIGFPIINQPNVAILGVGAIKKRPVVIETEQGDLLGIRPIGFLTLSYDHRIVDGELGDKFLQRVVHYLQNFDENWI
ncbi:MAG: 2-oxoglutarate dehydrogenase, E2 component, dihydrolipoamide succinyltransferase [Calditrichaeota bacterium]|nr:MAG: 2-oxoglutarate dehydrogenase, E2 component, dihydrolipoamide succinyltransferase [Calditrichota bacterium]